MCELPPSSNWAFDVQWSPKIPAILSSSSFDGEVSIFSLQSTSASSTTVNEWGAAQTTAGSSLRAPKWLKRPCGATFGFGGKLVSFSDTAGPSVVDTSVVTDSRVVDRAHHLQSALEQRKLESYCARRREGRRGRATARSGSSWVPCAARAAPTPPHLPRSGGGALCRAARPAVAAGGRRGRRCGVWRRRRRGGRLLPAGRRHRRGGCRRRRRLAVADAGGGAEGCGERRGASEQGDAQRQLRGGGRLPPEGGAFADACPRGERRTRAWTATRDKYLQTAQTPFMRMLKRMRTLRGMSARRRSPRGARPSPSSTPTPARPSSRRCATSLPIASTPSAATRRRRRCATCARPTSRR